MTPKQKEYKPIFEEYQRLKALYPYENKTELIKLMIGEHASKRDIAKYEMFCGGILTFQAIDTPYKRKWKNRFLCYGNSIKTNITKTHAKQQNALRIV